MEIIVLEVVIFLSFISPSVVVPIKTAWGNSFKSVKTVFFRFSFPCPQKFVLKYSFHF